MLEEKATQLESDFKLSHENRQKLVWQTILNGCNILFSSQTLLQEQDHLSYPEEQEATFAKTNPIADFEVVKNAKSKTKLASALNLICLHINQHVSLPVQKQDIRLLIEFQEEKQTVEIPNILRLGKYNDEWECLQYKEFFRDLHVNISQDANFKDALEEDNVIAEVIERLRSGEYKPIVQEFLEFKGLGKDLIEEVIDLDINLFPKYELYGYKQEYRDIKAKIWNRSFEQALLYNSLPKVTKISKTSFGKGIAIFNTQEIKSLQALPLQQQRLSICNLILEKIALKGAKFTLENIENFIKNRAITIKEYLPDFGSKSHCLNLSKLNLNHSNATDFQYTVIADSQEIKDENDKWIGTKVDFTSDLKQILIGTNFENKIELLLIVIESLHYLSLKTRFIGDNEKKSIVETPEDFTKLNFLFFAMDWAIMSEHNEVKRIKTIEWCGREAGSLNIIVEAKRKQELLNQEIRNCSFIRDNEFEISIDTFLANIYKFVTFLKTPIPKLQDQSLSQIISITSLLQKPNNNLSLGIVLYNEFSEEFELVNKILQDFFLSLK